jgi:hypothetical protein
MRRFVLHVSLLVLTFAIGTYANVLVNRAAHFFIPDVDPGPNVPYVIADKPKPKIEVFH